MERPARIVRINIRESDHGRRRGLMNEVLDVLRHEDGVDGVSVLRGIAGVNGDHVVHAADMIHFDVDLPLIIEFCAAPDIAQAAIDRLGDIVPAGHIVSWTVTRHG